MYISLYITVRNCVVTMSKPFEAVELFYRKTCWLAFCGGQRRCEMFLLYSKIHYEDELDR